MTFALQNRKTRTKMTKCLWVGIKLKVGFQSLKVISPTAGWILWCMQVNAGVGVVS